ncbi:hypothetical protein E5288_WYG008391 [Bos mutus]|uniref:Oxysterol-binding protein n=1 Tax=Bos mutus TaxID=72004 RepID=A0A6B0RNB3_9CETA|nr:hypothetical protein [Bos mutus]
MTKLQESRFKVVLADAIGLVAFNVNKWSLFYSEVLRNDFSIWSILRKCIGMELSKITMPVIFNEPLSFLQRLTDYMEHTYLIHKASSLADPVERMQCVAAFAVSAVASQWERTGKPFNPLLGETYELVRDDLGFRLISEQVSHHPPISAFHAEGLNNDFIFHGSIYPKLKFWGKSVEAEPKGTITLELLEHNEAYTWTNPTCCVHNIIVGKLWIEQYGNVEITNHKTGDKCVLNFKPCGLFGKELHKVEGYIQDKSKKKLRALYGKWTECSYSVDPATFDAYKKNDKKNTEEKKNSKQVSASEESDEMPMPDSESVFVIPRSVLLWRIAPRPPNSAQMYNFTSFAMVLNEVDKEMESVIPKTDCKLRPDIRAMENGEIDQASEEKKRLEEKQRAARKNRSKSEEDWKTRYTENVMRLSTILRDQPMKLLDRAVFWIEFVMCHKGAKHLWPADYLNCFQYHSLDMTGFLLACMTTVIFLLIKGCLLCYQKFVKTGKKKKRK